MKLEFQKNWDYHLVYLVWFVIFIIFCVFIIFILILFLKYSVFCRFGKDFELQELYDGGQINIEKMQDSDNSPFLEAILSDNIGFACRYLELCNGVGSLANGEFEFLPPIILEWCNSGILKDLNLNGNHLMNLPLELRKLKNCLLEENPLLSLPREIRTGKWPKIKKYLEILQERAVTWNYRKLMILGDIGSGKSSL